MSKDYNHDLAFVINKFLKDDDWKFSFDAEKGLFRFGLNLDCKLKSIDYVIDVGEDYYLVYTISPISADNNDPDCMARMAEFFTRANYGLKNGCFEMDFRDGEIRYRIYVDCDGQNTSSAVVRNSIYCAAAMMKRYSKGYLGVLFAGSDAESAVNLAEQR